MSEQGKKCPNCDRDIGLWAIIKAPVPSMMRCPHCKSPIQYDEAGWGLIFILLVICLPIFSIVFSGMPSLYTMGTIKMSVVVVLISLLIWLPFELILALYLRKNQKIVLR